MGKGEVGEERGAMAPDSWRFEGLIANGHLGELTLA